MHLILRNWLNPLKNTALDICQLITLMTMYILITTTWYHKSIIKFSYCIRNLIYITSPLKLLAEKLLSLPKIFVEDILEPWIKHNTQIVAQLSKTDAYKKHSKNNNKCTFEENMGQIFWVMSILPDFSIS